MWQDIKKIIDPKEDKPQISKANYHPNEPVEIALNDYQDEKLTISVSRAGELIENLETKIEDGNLKVSSPRDFKPGKYTVKVSTSDVNDELVEQDFTWGVLAININKSIYLPDEKAYLQMAVLDDDGHTLCKVALKLEIRTPQSEVITLLSSDGTIKNSETCGANNVTDDPDYLAYFQTEEIGLYQLKLTNLDNGYEIEDSFEVKENIPFEVERITATRINPYKANYVMNFNITANQDFKGEIRETVPASFEILDHDVFSSNENEKSLVWQVEWQKGGSYELSYEYDAPDVSPQFYLLGPLKIGYFQEDR